MHVEAALPKAVDIFPCLWRVEGQDCRTDAHDWAILIVHLLLFKRQPSLQETDNAWDWCDAIELWSREFRTRMEVQSVDNSVDKPGDGENGGANDGWHKETHDGR